MLPIAAAISVLAGFAFAVAQQNLREAGNDPQIQMAEDAAARLASGTSPGALVPSQVVDASSSLAPFLIIYDDRNTVIASSARVTGATPHLPSGVLDSARSKGEDRVTWEPSPGVRIAAVVVRSPGGGAVLAGRSLREVEHRESDLLGIAAAAWLFALVAVGATTLGIEVIAGGKRVTS